jgi:site-specific DNA-methyltransferase (adenine-specific)
MDDQLNLFPSDGETRRKHVLVKRETVDAAGEADPVEPKTFARFVLPKHKELRLYLGDCLLGMERLLKPESVDVIVTSPPYNIGVNYGRYDDHIPRTVYLDWIAKWGHLVERVLKYDGSLFLNVGSKPSDPWVPFDVANQLRDTLVLQNVFHWIKSIYIRNSSYDESTSLVVGHFKPINSRRFVNDAHEYVFHFTKSGEVALDRAAIGAPYKDPSNISRWKSAGGGVRCRGNNWYIPYSTIRKRMTDRPHPASFPPELAEMSIKLHGLSRVNLVLDPFLGIGNTAVACARLAVNMTGFDIDREYLEVAGEILEKLNGTAY